MAAMSLAIAVPAQTVTNTFQQTPGQLIPDANPTGYASTNIVSGVSGVIQDLTVMLDITGGVNGDLFAYLSFNNGYTVLLNRIGKDEFNPYGSGSSGVEISLNDAAGSDIHLYHVADGDLLAGTWQPDGREADPQLVVGSDARTALLASFNNLDPNGSWTLFVADMATDYQSTLVSWSLVIVTIPEPATDQFLAIFGGFALATVLWRRRLKS